jgi:hypothetical protein
MPDADEATRLMVAIRLVLRHREIERSRMKHLASRSISQLPVC